MKANELMIGDWVQTTNPNQISYANTIMKQDFIKDFKNHMEGE